VVGVEKSEAKDEKIVCVDCDRVLQPEEKGRSWDTCHFCQKPICSNCTPYRKTYKAFWLCKRCHAKQEK